jgi:hypothetical protein
MSMALRPLEPRGAPDLSCLAAAYDKPYERGIIDGVQTALSITIRSPCAAIGRPAW